MVGLTVPLKIKMWIFLGQRGGKHGITFY